MNQDETEYETGLDLALKPGDLVKLKGYVFKNFGSNRTPKPDVPAVTFGTASPDGYVIRDKPFSAKEGKVQITKDHVGMIMRYAAQTSSIGIVLFEDVLHYISLTCLEKLDT